MRGRRLPAAPSRGRSPRPPAGSPDPRAACLLLGPPAGRWGARASWAGHLPSRVALTLTPEPFPRAVGRRASSPPTPPAGPPVRGVRHRAPSVPRVEGPPLRSPARSRAACPVRGHVPGGGGSSARRGSPATQGTARSSLLSAACRALGRGVWCEDSSGSRPRLWAAGSSVLAAADRRAGPASLVCGCGRWGCSQGAPRTDDRNSAAHQNILFFANPTKNRYNSVPFALNGFCGVGCCHFLI